MMKKLSRHTDINTKNEKMKIVVLSITPYKEKDGIIDAISEKGDITFTAKGIFDPKNKNAALNNALTIADIELQEGKYKYPLLKNASIVANPMKIKSDYYYLASIMLIGELTKSLLQDEEKERIFNSLLSTLICLKNVEKPWAILLSYIANLLAITGYEFSVNECVFCGSKQKIATFSFNDGGFVCQNCLQEDMLRDLSKEQMLLIRNAFNYKEAEKANYPVEEKDAKIVLNKLFEFISESFGIKIKSRELILK